jgi:hypothetical protein
MGPLYVARFTRGNNQPSTKKAHEPGRWGPQASGSRN